jgi:hypothetical protein
MCSVQIKLAEQYETEALAYRSAVARMKESRGQEFERAWRLVEHRRVSLEQARRVLRAHEMEHICDLRESFAATSRGRL